MEKSDKNRVIALAAMFQACDLVDELAYQGSADEEAIRPLIHAIFDNSSRSIEAIYEGSDSLKPGFDLAVGILTNPGKGRKSMDITRYTITLLHLERKLQKKPAMGKKMIKDIEGIERQIQYFGGILNNAVISRLADIYQETISTLEPKIIIKGEQAHLDTPEVAAKIRALLLSGIRSAVLWRQAGGGRFSLMFRRKQLADEAKRLQRPLKIVH